MIDHARHAVADEVVAASFLQLVASMCRSGSLGTSASEGRRGTLTVSARRIGFLAPRRDALGWCLGDHRAEAGAMLARAPLIRLVQKVSLEATTEKEYH